MTARRTATVIAIALIVGGCGATTFDQSRATTTAVATTTTLPVGDAAELLPRLDEALSGLSVLIGPRPENSPQPAIGKREQLQLVLALWNAVRDEVTDLDPEAADSLQRMIDLAVSAVERNRPADADKAAKFAAPVIEKLSSEL